MKNFFGVKKKKKKLKMNGREAKSNRGTCFTVFSVKQTQFVCNFKEHIKVIARTQYSQERYNSLLELSKWLSKTQMQTKMWRFGR